jgi:hypothetical protein
MIEAQNQSQARTKSTKLEQGLSEADVSARIGKPDSISLRTCGGKTGNPWMCKQYNYGNNALTIFFSQSLDGTWLVNNWTAL